MAECLVTDYLLFWEKQEREGEHGIQQFEGPADVQIEKVNNLRNLAEDTKFWIIDASQAITINTIKSEKRNGQLSDDNLFVCGFFVVKGTVEHLMKRYEEIDFGFIEKYINNLDDDGMEDLIAHSTFTFAPIQEFDASIVLVWAKRASDEVRFPVDMVLDIINAYNVWGRRLHNEKVLLDAGRMFVRHNRFHLENGQKLLGPKNIGRLVGLGSYNRETVDIEGAFSEAGLDISNMVVELAGCNGYCLAMSAVDEYLLHPRNEIFV